MCAFSVARKVLLSQSVRVVGQNGGILFSASFSRHSRSLKTYRPVSQLQCVLMHAFGTVAGQERERERQFEERCSLGIRSSDGWPFVTLP